MRIKFGRSTLQSVKKGKHVYKFQYKIEDIF